jgi:hypothetical protein
VGNQAESTQRECNNANLGESERTEMMRENGVGFKRRSALVDFDRMSKSTHTYFWIWQKALSTQRYFDTW